MSLPKNSNKVPRHIAVIMDGNGRWAKEKKLPVTGGHKAGAETVRKIVRHCAENGVQFLTLYAFSTENWKRPKIEVTALIHLLKIFLKKYTKELSENGIRFNTIGRTEMFSKEIRKILTKTKKETSNCNKMVLTLALSYGSRTEIADAARTIAESAKNGILNLEEITEKTISDNLYTSDMPDPDILIRTSGEIRLSNFLLWQLSYSEMFFTDTYWPDFSTEELDTIIAKYDERNRHFGGR
ncbi:MAG: isoprenyl transferase [Verrucomicrobiota bacterium]|nr:isoprenyl transferase [Verrucomicrobiota bacterium]